MTAIAVELDPALVAELEGLERWEVDIVLSDGRLLLDRRPLNPPPSVTEVAWTVSRAICAVGHRLFLNGGEMPSLRGGQWDLAVGLEAGDTLAFVIFLDVGGSRR